MKKYKFLVISKSYFKNFHLAAKLKPFVLNYKIWLWGSVAFYLIMASVYAIMSLVNNSHYLTLGDLGIFNQGIWQYSQFKWPEITFHLSRPFLGDHFHPILMILAPLYWFYQGEEVLLIAQPFIILSAIIPLFLIGYKLTKSLFFSFSVIFAYAFYIPLQYTIFYDFHEIVFLPPLFAWLYYWVIKDKKLLTAIFIFLCLLIKEEVGFFIAAFGIYLFIFEKKWRIFGLVTAFSSIAFSLLLIHKLIPIIGGNYLYFNYGEMGQTPIDVIKNVIQNPKLAIQLFFEPDVKLLTIKRTFWPLAYLPLFSPLGFILSFEQFFSRFMDFRSVRWTIGYHYSAIMTVVVAIGTIDSIRILKSLIKNTWGKILINLIALLIIVLTRLEQINVSAVLLIKYPQFWERPVWIESVDKALSLLPKNASICTQNNITAHVSTRKEVYQIDDFDICNRAEYILADFHPGQSDYNFFGSENKIKFEKMINDNLRNKIYELVYHDGDVYLIRKIKLKGAV